jgi:two-component system, chemotaxis family, sensor kinase CheA
MAENTVAQTFVLESHELLDQLDTDLVELERDGSNPEVLNRVFRAAHTLKGGAGMVGERTIVELAHAAEHVLDAARRGSLRIDSATVSDLLAASDGIRALVSSFERGEALSGEPFRNLRNRLAERADAAGELAQAPRSRRPRGPCVYQIKQRFSPSLLRDGVDPLLLIDELKSIGDLLQVDLDPSAVPPLEQLTVDELYLTWTAYLRTTEPQCAVEAVFLFVWDESRIEVTDVTDRIGQYIDLSVADKRLGELLVAECQVPPEQLERALGQQKRIGELLVESGAVTPEALSRTLEKQNVLRSLRRSATVKVDATKIDALLNLVGELVTAVAQSTVIVMNGGVAKNVRRASMETLERIARDLQDGVTRMRMVPIDELFSRFPRIVRDVADQLGKQVDLQILGGEAELDRGLVELLVDPLKHMIRNSLDHGLESPAERTAAGKEPRGRLVLSAAHREGKVEILVTDDGRGINKDRVRTRAVDRGLIGPNDQPSDRALFDFLFQPGFSTAEQVSEISGRGVGLDVVRRNVEELGGNVDVESTEQKGCTFRIRLPLTLAIIDALIVRLGKERIAFPLLGIVELIYPKLSELRAAEGSRWMIRARGSFVPMVWLSELFGTSASRSNPVDSMVIILGSEGHRFGVVVDDAVSTQQIVVKTLDTTFDCLRLLDPGVIKPSGIAGAAVLPDGDVALIADIFGLERMAVSLLQHSRRRNDGETELCSEAPC